MERRLPFQYFSAYAIVNAHGISDILAICFIPYVQRFPASCKLNLPHKLALASTVVYFALVPTAFKPLSLDLHSFTRVEHFAFFGQKFMRSGRVDSSAVAAHRKIRQSFLKLLLTNLFLDDFARTPSICQYNLDLVVQQTTLVNL